jgi:hypothetical protein
MSFFQNLKPGSSNLKSVFCALPRIRFHKPLISRRLARFPTISRPNDAYFPPRSNCILAGCEISRLFFLFFYFLERSAIRQAELNPRDAGATGCGRSKSSAWRRLSPLIAACRRIIFFRALTARLPANHVILKSGMLLALCSPVLLTGCASSAYDARGDGSEICEIHHTYMQSVEVSASSHNFQPTQEYLEARTRLFRHSYPFALPERARTTYVIYLCDDCVRAEAAWKTGHDAVQH